MQTRIIETRSIGSRSTAVMSTDIDIGEVGDWLSRVFPEVDRHLTASGNPPIGPPFARFHRVTDGRFQVEAGYPVARPVASSNLVHGSSLPSGTVAVTTHLGPYDEIAETYEALFAWIASRDSTPTGDHWEVYFSGPDEASSTWRTVIYQPYRPV
ncbi:MAG: GyrI-like domain-containing protein [Acidimicrobiia bacterium]